MDDYDLVRQAFGDDPPSWVIAALPDVFDDACTPHTASNTERDGRDMDCKRTRRLDRCKNGDCCVFNPNYDRDFVFGDHNNFRCYHVCNNCVCGALCYIVGIGDDQKARPFPAFASTFKWDKLKRRGKSIALQ